MKKLTAILILFLLLIGQCGYYCFCAYQLYQAKQSAKFQLLSQASDNLFTKISLTDNNKLIVWEEAGKEFTLNSNKYDVVKIINDKDNQYALCLSDTKEDEVLQSLNTAVKYNIESATNANSKHSTLNKITMPDWLFEESNADVKLTFITTKNKEYRDYKSDLTYNNY